MFYTYFYNHARRPRVEKLVHLELHRSPKRNFKPLLDPGGGFRIETTVMWPFQKQNGYKFITVSVYQRLRMQIDPFVSAIYHIIYIYRIEIKPGQHSDTRIKPLPLTKGHGRF